MGTIKDDRGYNQLFIPSKALSIRTKRRSDLIIKNLNFKGTSGLLEIGCGKGENSFLIAKKTGASVLGTDICVPFIDEARKTYQLPNLSFEVMDFNLPGLVNRRFDYIVGNGILHHLYYKLDDALRNIHSLLNEKGKILFWEPNILNPYCYIIFTYPYFRKRAHLEPDEMAFSKRFVTQKLSKAGFSGINVEYRDFLLPDTPQLLISPVIMAGAIAEKIPLIKCLSQSIFIQAEK